MSPATCSWCRADVAVDEGYRARRPASGQLAVFCRLEHIVPWVLRGARWPTASPGAPADDAATDSVEGPRPGQAPSHAAEDPAAEGSAPSRCSHCDAELGAEQIVLVHHRGEHRITDAFCDTDHLRRWANAGGRFNPR